MQSRAAPAEWGAGDEQALAPSGMRTAMLASRAPMRGDRTCRPPSGRLRPRDIGGATQEGLAAARGDRLLPGRPQWRDRTGIAPDFLVWHRVLDGANLTRAVLGQIWRAVVGGPTVRR
ncbi:hypothetical protein GCM10009855_25540 [Gordonia cholesterolivorans]|uniref:Uncharacterized protein n=1 Tax=Gordonia cholesterolivorans TaxID=559625 RepID=A0ABP5UQL6_9ACTN